MSRSKVSISVRGKVNHIIPLSKKEKRQKNNEVGKIIFVIESDFDSNLDPDLDFDLSQNSYHYTF